MLISELIAATLFLVAVALVYRAAFAALHRRLVRRQAPERPGRERAVFALAIAGLGCMAYGYLVEPYWIEVRRVEVPSPRIPASAGRIRVALLSDLHSDPKARLEPELPELVRAEAPDLIVFTGDSVNSPAGLENFRACLAALSAIAPTFVVKGNWDTMVWPGLRFFEGTGARELDGDAAEAKVRGASVWVAGVASNRQGQADAALGAVPAGAPAIFLHHYPYPDILSPENRARVDLFAAGHVHGGQIALPLYGALVTLSKHGKRYESGLYQVDSMALYVSRGVGMEGKLAPRVRFLARPELAIIDLVPASSP